MGELSWADIAKVAELTNGQRDNKLWLDLRRFRLTGSNFGKIYNILNSDRQDYENVRAELFEERTSAIFPL